MACELFDLTAERLEHHTSLDRMEARGTLRIALKEAGLDPQSIALTQLYVLFEKVMPGELKSRGVRDSDVVCRAVMDDVTSSWTAAGTPSPASPDDIFRRLGGD